METFPKIGMKFEQVRSRLKKYDTINKHGNVGIANSLLKQAKLHEGGGAVQELCKEFADPNIHSLARVGGGSDLYKLGYERINWNGSG